MFADNVKMVNFSLEKEWETERKKENGEHVIKYFVKWE